MVRLDAGNSLYRDLPAFPGMQRSVCFWVYLFATARTITYLDEIPGSNALIGWDSALTYQTYGSWDHASSIPAMQTPNDFPAYHSFFWFGQRAGFPEVHVRDGRPEQRDLGNGDFQEVNTGADLVVTSSVSLTANACHHVAYTCE